MIGGLDSTKTHIALDVRQWNTETGEILLTDVSLYFRSESYRRWFDRFLSVFSIKGSTCFYYIRDWTGDMTENDAKRIATHHYEKRYSMYRLD